MKYDLRDTINAAFMTHRPVVLVEGYDDIKFYSNIAVEEKLKIEVKAVENIDGYGEGCEQVIKAVEELSNIINSDDRLKKFFLGIIDRDVRSYRNTLPTNDNILILKYYSYETHLITRKTVARLLEFITKAPATLITDLVIDHLFNKFDNDNLDKLYYFSLEALKNSCIPGYSCEITYSMKEGNLVGNGGDYWYSRLSDKIGLLDQFANKLGIDRKQIKYIAKGKWYLRFWSHFLEHYSHTLSNLCGNIFPICVNCMSGKKDKCLWKRNDAIVSTTIEELLPTRQFIDFKEV